MIEIVTLGGATARRDGQELQKLGSHRQLYALFVYLAMEGPVSRTRLTSVFWPERDEEKARHSLSQAIYALRQELGEGFLKIEADSVSVPDGAFKLDANELRDAIRRQDWSAVIELYGGPFLEGLSLPGAPAFDAWRSSNRARLASDARLASERLQAGAKTRKGSSSGGWNRLLEGLQSRLFFRTVLVYLGASWLAVQLTDILVDREILPDAAFPIVLYIVAVGFPAALIIAWAQERRLETEPAKGRRQIGYAVAAVALLSLFLIPLLGRFGEPRDRASFPATRIAVLYFDDHSADGELGYLADALTEHLTHELAQISALDVAPRNAVKPYREAGIPSDSIAAVLGAGTLVEGSVLGFEDSIRISVQLIDARSMSHLTSAIVVGAAEDLFELLDDVGERIAGLLRRELGMEIQIREWRAGTRSTAAWERVKRANSVLNDYEALVMSGDEAAAARSLDLADTLLARAEAADPRWVEPIIQRGWIAANRAMLVAGQGRDHDPPGLEVGIAHAARALALDPESSGAYELRGILVARLAGETDDADEAGHLLRRAEADLRQATELDEARARAWSRLSRILADRGQLLEAKLAAQRAYEADAFLRDADLVLARLCEMSIQLQDWDEVTRWCELGRKRFEDDEYFAAAELTALAGPVGPEPDVELAWALVDRTLALSPPQDRDGYRPGLLMQLAAVLARAGRADSARAVIAQARAAGRRDDSESDYQEANARLILGEADEALRLLERFLAAEPEYRQFLASDWWFERLYDDSRFQALVADNG
jgi:TolB-like protein/DNA-binding SARP family transcriptional activator